MKATARWSKPFLGWRGRSLRIGCTGHDACDQALEGFAQCVFAMGHFAEQGSKRAPASDIVAMLAGKIAARPPPHQAPPWWESERRTRHA
jgi:hypothetical protein